MRPLSRRGAVRYAHPISRRSHDGGVSSARMWIAEQSVRLRMCAPTSPPGSRGCFRVRISIGEPVVQRLEIRGRTPVNDAYCPRDPMCAVLMNAKVRPFEVRASLCGRLANHTPRCCHSHAVGDLNAHRARRDPCSWVSKEVTLSRSRGGSVRGRRFVLIASSLKTRSSSEVFDVE